jgi:hypothetical protein
MKYPYPSMIAIALAALLVGAAACRNLAAEPGFAVVFSGGHETDPRDGARPVVLIAAALGVTPEMFREAFRSVTPARNGRPSEEQVHRNKAVLMKVLGPYGITNERLDEVSDYYRYRPQRGELWTNTPGRAHAIVKNGRIREIVITERGSGYTMPPRATIKGMEGLKLKVKIAFDKDLRKNGAVRSVEMVSGE